MNVLTSAPLVSDPKMKIESLFDDNNEFKFKGFKPVPKRVFLKQNKDDPIGEDDTGDKEDEDSGSSSSSSDEEEKEKQKKKINNSSGSDEDNGHSSSDDE